MKIFAIDAGNIESGYAITALREKCVEKQEFLIGEDNRYKGYVSIEDLDYIIEESGIRS